MFHWAQVHRCLKEVFSFENLLFLCQYIPWCNCFLFHHNLSLFTLFFIAPLPKQYRETILMKKGSKEIVARLPKHSFLPFQRKPQLILLYPLQQQNLYFWKRSYWYCEAAIVINRVHSSLLFFYDSFSSSFFSFSPLKILLSCQLALEDEEI